MTVDQLDIFSVPTHRNDPTTSREAAAKVRAADQFRRVLACLAEHPEGLTDDELADELGLLRNSAGTRRGNAVRLGFVESCGTRLNDRQNKATVWRLTMAGVAEASRLRMAA